MVITGRRAEVLEKTSKEIEAETGGKVLGVPGDVRKIEDVENTLKEAVSAFGSVEILINNAAGNFISPTERLSHRAFESIIGIVLQGTANFTLTLGKYWIEKGIKGNVMSIGGHVPLPEQAHTIPSAYAKSWILAVKVVAEWEEIWHSIYSHCSRSLSHRWSLFKVISRSC